MIIPATIPQFVGNLEQLDKDVAGLRRAASGIERSGTNIHSRFQAIGAYYQAPEAEQLLSTTQPVMDTAQKFSDDLEKVANALAVYAAEVQPLAKKLKRLREQAGTFVASVDGDDDWTNDQGKLDEHQSLLDGVAETVAAIQAAERRTADKINAASGAMCRPKLTANDGSGQPHMYGYDAKTLKEAGQLPWGTPEERTYKAWTVDWFTHGTKEFGKGVVIDGLGGAVDGLYTLAGGHGSDRAGQAWSFLGDAAGGLGQYLATPYTAIMDWTLGAPEDTSDEDRQKQAFKDFGKGLVGWDMWGENSPRAAGVSIFNGITIAATPVKIATAGKASAGAKAASNAARVGELLDPLTAGTTAAGKAFRALPTIAEVTTRLNTTFKTPAPEIPHSILKTPDGSQVLIKDGQFIPANRDGSPNTTPAPREPAASQLTEPAPTPSRHELVGAATRAPDPVSREGGNLPPQASHETPRGSEGTGAASGAEPDRAGGRAAAQEVATGAGHSQRGTDQGGPGRTDDGDLGSEGREAPGPRTESGAGDSVDPAPAADGSSTTPGTGGGTEGGGLTETPKGVLPERDPQPMVRGSETEQQIRDALKGVPGKQRPKPPTLETVLDRLASHSRGQEVADVLASSRFNTSENFGTVISSLGAKKEGMFQPGMDQILFANDLHRSGVPAQAIDFEVKNAIGGDMDVVVKGESGEVYGYQMKRLNNPIDPVGEMTRGKYLLQLKKSSADHRVLLVDGQGTLADWQAKGAYDDLMDIHQGGRGPKGEGITFVVRLDDGTLVIPPGSKTDPKDML